MRPRSAAPGITAIALAFLATTSQAAPADSLPPPKPVVADTVALPPPTATEPDTLVPRPTAEPRHRTVTQRVGHTGKVFADDVGYVVAAPFRLNRYGAAWTVAIVGTTAILYANDQAILDAFHDARGNSVYDAVVKVGDNLVNVGHAGRIAPYLVGIAALSTAFHIEGVKTLTLEVIESNLISGGIRNSAKLLLGRRRPFENRGPYFFEFNGGTSFPSGHASVVFELATMFSRTARSQPPALRIPVNVVSYGLATAICVQRIDSDGHWPSDVFLSAAQGAVIASTVFRRNEERRRLAPEMSFGPEGPRFRLVHDFTLH